jgi:CrcB protein
MIKQILFVGLGGGIGAILRYCCSLLIPSGSFPLATFLINITGSLLLGMVMASTMDQPAAATTRLFLATGICGGFTTFSAFAYENITLMQAGKYDMAFLYILLSVLVSLLATWLGLKIIQS